MNYQDKRHFIVGICLRNSLCGMTYSLRSLNGLFFPTTETAKLGILERNVMVPKNLLFVMLMFDLDKG